MAKLSAPPLCRTVLVLMASEAYFGSVKDSRKSCSLPRTLTLHTASKWVPPQTTFLIRSPFPPFIFTALIRGLALNRHGEDRREMRGVPVSPFDVFMCMPLLMPQCRLQTYIKIGSAGSSCDWEIMQTCDIWKAEANTNPVESLPCGLKLHRLLLCFHFPAPITNSGQGQTVPSHLHFTALCTHFFLNPYWEPDNGMAWQPSIEIQQDYPALEVWYTFRRFWRIHLDWSVRIKVTPRAWHTNVATRQSKQAPN